MSIPYIMPILVERLNAEDLEGLETLPDVLKPPTTQKPQVMIDPPENSEEVRVVLAEIVTVIVSTTVFDCLRAYIDVLCNVIRALCMDPYGGVIIEGCQAMCDFCLNGQDQLLHFSENLGRSLFTSFINKHAKVRIAGLKALKEVLQCGVFKYNANIMEHIIGFRDPNIVPIKDFYEATTKLNYFAMFVADRSTVVREHFYKTIASLAMSLPDKKDHEGRLFPYLISGLYDQNDQIQETVFDLIEELGKQYEEEYEKDIREIKQLGFQPEWTHDGKVRDSDLILPLPFVQRPCLGSRILVRSYVRRYLHALYKEINDWIQENRERASNLMLSCILYTEDFMTQFLDHTLVAMYKAVLEKENKTVMKNVKWCLRLIGRYCTPKAYIPLVMQAIKNELASYYPHTQPGAIRSFGYLFAGTIEVYPKGSDLSRVKDYLQDFISAVNTNVLDGLDSELADNLIESLTIIVDQLQKLQDRGIDISEWHKHQKDVFYMIIRSLGVYSNYKLLGKAESTLVQEQKAKCISLLNKLTLISHDPETDFFEKYLRDFFQEQFPDDVSIEQTKDWLIHSQKFRMFFVVYEFLEEKHLSIHLDSEATYTIQDRVSSIINSILLKSESQNYNVKQIVLITLIPQFINKTCNMKTSEITIVYFQMLQQASKTEWKMVEDTVKNQIHLIKLHTILIDKEYIILTLENLEVFSTLIKSFDTFLNSKKDNVRHETLALIRQYLQLFSSKILQGAKINENLEIMTKLDFLPALGELLLKSLTDYFDTVREQAQLMLRFIVDNFIPGELGFNSEQDELLQILRANAQLGWSSPMGTKLKQAAEMESALVQHIFKDPQSYIKNIIAIMMDETAGKDNLVQIIFEFNKRLPFMVLNDYRIAQATNSLRRAEILKNMVFKQ